MDITALIIAAITVLLGGWGIFLWSSQRYKLRAEALKAESEALKARSEALKAEAEARSEEAEAQKLKTEASATLSATALNIVARWEVRVKALEQVVDEQRSCYATLQQDYIKLQEEFRVSVTSLRKQLEDVTRQLEEVQLENEGLKGRIAELEKENRELRLCLPDGACRTDRVS